MVTQVRMISSILTRGLQHLKRLLFCPLRESLLTLSLDNFSFSYKEEFKTVVKWLYCW